MPEKVRVVELLGGATARIRELTGRDEDWLAAAGPTPAALAVSNLIGACVELGGATPSVEAARMMLVGDRDYAMLQLRAVTLGERVLAVVTCPACSSNVDVAFDVAEVPVARRPQRGKRHVIDYRGRAIAFRLPSGADAEAILGLNLDDAERALYDRCVEGGVKSLSAGARRAVDAAMERLAPQVDLELELLCPECSAQNVVAFDCTAFFLRELRSQSAHLLREIHALAVAYHWSEDAILGLPRQRRRAYLELVSESLVS